jgi:DNA-binding NarL/FixJ family response regulator
MGPFRVLLVDDHAIVRRGLAALVSTNSKYRIEAEAKDGEEALIKLETIPVDIAIVDLYMPRLNGLETLRRIVRQYPRVKVVVLSMYDDEQFVSQAFHDGATGYLLKQAIEDELFEALDSVMAGKRFVSAGLDPAGVKLWPVDEPDLTVREREVLTLIVEGHTTQDLAEILSISPHTATRHRANLMQKLKVHTQMELVRTAVERGLVVLSRPPLNI